MTPPDVPNRELDADAKRLQKMAAAAENWILRYYQAIEDGSVTVGHWISS